MKISTTEKIGLTSLGLAGNILLAAVIWAQISPWWLILSVFLILSAVGVEIGKTKNN
jgi:hypothetical protein